MYFRTLYVYFFFKQYEKCLKINQGERKKVWKKGKVFRVINYSFFFKSLKNTMHVSKLLLFSGYNNTIFLLAERLCFFFLLQNNFEKETKMSLW